MVSMPPEFGQLVGLGKVRGTITITRGGWPLLGGCTAFISSSILPKAETLVPQAEGFSFSRATIDSDFVSQLKMICDSVLYACLSKIADTAKKRYYLDLSYTAVTGQNFRGGLDAFLNNLHEFEVLDLHLHIFEPYDLRVPLVVIDSFVLLSCHFEDLRSDLERSKEFHYEGGLFHAIVATLYMRFLRTT